jgi:hypothetical protein
MFSAEFYVVVGASVFIVLFLAGVISTISFLANIFLFWYSKKLITKIYFISEDVTSLLNEVTAFGTHLSSVHELEMFYGDEVLGNLIRHSKDLLGIFKEFEDTHELFDEDNFIELEELTEIRPVEVTYDAHAETEE